MISTTMRIVIFVLAAIFLVTAIAHAGERPTLRSDITVTTNLVRIGDLVENAGIVAEVAVFRAPALGETGRVPVAQVLEALRAHALVGLNPGSITEVTVTRASRAIPPQEIEGLITAALARDYTLGDPADISLSFERALRTVHVETAQGAAPRLSQLRYNARTGEFDATIEIPGASGGLRLAGVAMATLEVVTLARPVGRGEIIRMDDVTLRRVPRAAAGTDAITDPDQAIGLTPRSAMSTNRPLRAAELMKPEIVQRGANVTISYSVPGVMLAARGKAQEGGAEGDMIDVLNVQSNRMLRATVIGPGQVAVMSMTPRVVAAAEVTDLSRNPPADAAK
jgi:flagella basal body P-ring formation protein FlgA